MRTVLIRAGVVAASLLAPLALQAPRAEVAAAVTQAAASARVIVKLRAESALLRIQALSPAAQKASRTQALAQRIGVEMAAGASVGERSHVVFASGLSSADLAARLSSQSDVEYAVVDGRKHIVAAPNDPFYATVPLTGASSGGPLVGQWYLKPPGPVGNAATNTAPSAINVEQAWDLPSAKGNTSIVVAILDTGLRFDHPDLVGANVIAGYDLVSADSAGVFTTANDGDGRDADPSDPGDFVTSAEAGSLSCSQRSSSWHGTHMAGVIGAATNNGIGMAGVAPGVRVMPVRVLGKCGGYDSDVIAGMRWAAGLDLGDGTPVNANKARVLNLSLGETGVACNAAFSNAIQEVRAAGVVVVAAAGNDYGIAPGSPANCPGVIAVGALRSDGDKNNFSNLGSAVTISAPGGNCGPGSPPAACQYPILTLTNAGTTTPVTGAAGGKYKDSFDYAAGTSYSTPMVAGTVALMLSAQPSLTPDQVKTKLQATARAFPTTGSTVVPNPPTCGPATSSEQEYCYCTTAVCGAGMLDAQAAVASVSGVQAVITLTTTTPIAGQAVILSSGSVFAAGHSAATYLWSIVAPGAPNAAIVGAADGSSVSVQPTAGGTFTIQLTVTDNTGAVSSATTSVAVAPAVMSAPAAPAPVASSGGGAIGIGWLLLLLAASLALAANSRLERRRLAHLSASARPSRRR